jgi:hypothetical protein
MCNVADVPSSFLAQMAPGNGTCFWYGSSVCRRLGCILGLCAGGWLGADRVLRERMRVGGWWIAASVIGCAIYGGVFNIVLKTTSQTEGAAVIGASIGILLGLAQWLVLRSQVARSGWWILSSGVGWCAGWISSQFAFEELGFLWAAMTPGLVSGAITGISLVWMLKLSWAGR